MFSSLNCELSRESPGHGKLLTFVVRWMVGVSNKDKYLWCLISGAVCWYSEAVWFKPPSHMQSFGAEVPKSLSSLLVPHLHLLQSQNIRVSLVVALISNCLDIKVFGWNMYRRSEDILSNVVLCVAEKAPNGFVKWKRIAWWGTQQKTEANRGFKNMGGYKGSVATHVCIGILDDRLSK